MHPVHTGPLTGFVGLLALLGALAATVGLSGPAWVVGIGSGAVITVALVRGLVRHRAVGLGPADRFTLTRAILAAGVAALTAASFTRSVPVTTLVTLAAVALVLDAVDGRVARRTRTASRLGARFDLEVDAFLILVLSVYVARSLGWWVLAIGLARYGFVAAGRVLPWLRGSLPPRHWCKVVAAIQGIVLTLAAAAVLPDRWSRAALAVALVLLAESFGREAWQLWQLRSPATGPRRVRVAPGTATALAGVAVWCALVLPNEVSRLTPGSFASIPLEGLLLVVLALVLPPRARRMAAALSGVLLGLLVTVKVFDMGFFAVLDRPFDPVNDWAYLGPAVGVLGDSIGRVGAISSAFGAAVLVLVVLGSMPWSVIRLSRLVASHRPRSVRAVTALGIVWVLCAVSGLQLAPGARVASTSASVLAYDEVSQLHAGIADRKTFARSIERDRYRDLPGDRLLTGLRGKDVIVAFVESYGRVAIQDSAFSPGVEAVLDAGTERLHAAGFSSRSAFLTSPTFGAASWLAHATLQSGLWVDSQQRYNQLVTRDRLTLTGAFKRAGWRTVFDVPSITHDWPDGAAFYDFDQLYDVRNVGYAGPEFGYATMPDQFTLSAFQRRELAPSRRAPVMAEIDLVSSHHPWTPLPHLLDWDQVGDGSVFDGMPEQGESSEAVFSDPDKVRAAYGRSIEYTLETLVSFVQTYPDPDLVLILVGDHQPHTYVSGDGAGHDVPITVIAHDPAVMGRIADWGWQSGMKPGPDAPVWRMDTFRDRLLDAFGAPPIPAGVDGVHPR